MTTSAPENDILTKWSWLKSLSPEIGSLDGTPLLGFCPPFPWQALSEALGKCFGLTNSQITPGDIAWRSAEEVMQSIAPPQKGACFTLSGLEGYSSLWISESDLFRLMLCLLGIKECTVGDDTSNTLPAFHQFLCLELTQLIADSGFNKQLLPQLSHQEPQINQPHLCQDIIVHINEEKFFARVAISPTLRASWHKEFSKMERLHRDNERLRNASSLLQLEAGCVYLSKVELDQLQTGDFIFLDKSWLSSEQEKNYLILSLCGRPLFKVKLKQGGLKIIETLSYEQAMELSLEYPKEGIQDVNPSLSDAKKMVTSDNTQQTHKEELTKEKELSEEPDNLEAIEEEEILQNETEEPLPQTTSSPGPTSIGLSDVPLPVVIELGRIRIDMQKLLELQPGNILDLNVSPHEPVKLTIHGKIVGHGEVIKMGDVLGVRVIDFKP